MFAVKADDYAILYVFKQDTHNVCLTACSTVCLTACSTVCLTACSTVCLIACSTCA